MSAPDLKSVKFATAVSVAPGGGSHTFGNTVIAWVPASTAYALTVTVTMGGMMIAQQTLTPDSNQMPFNAVSGKDSSQGALNASFGPTGMTGQLFGSVNYCGKAGQQLHRPRRDLGS